MAVTMISRAWFCMILEFADGGCWQIDTLLESSVDGASKHIGSHQAPHGYRVTRFPVRITLHQVRALLCCC
ncbi:hypothetical protein B0J18DRAFT_421516 [Chaetomium sp. MPI-SDFR-AT-0129]|nr:hypothetical protein B0J18DRAFT_421516 [Chaetomium sp. MPI-SDFR-AT-0129]